MSPHNLAQKLATHCFVIVVVVVLVVVVAVVVLAVGEVVGVTIRAESCKTSTIPSAAKYKATMTIPKDPEPRTILGCGRASIH